MATSHDAEAHASEHEGEKHGRARTARDLQIFDRGEPTVQDLSGTAEALAQSHMTQRAHLAAPSRALSMRSFRAGARLRFRAIDPRFSVESSIIHHIGSSNDRWRPIADSRPSNASPGRGCAC
jgi:hypothetical protein